MLTVPEVPGNISFSEDNFFFFFRFLLIQSLFGRFCCFGFFFT